MKNHYLDAHRLWLERGEKIPWNDLLTHFFHYGAVINTPSLFLLARPCLVEMSDDELNALSPLQFQKPANCWNVWLALGNLDTALELAKRHHLKWLAFQRHGQWEHRRVSLDKIISTHHRLNHENSQAAPAPGPSPTGFGQIHGSQGR